MIIGIDFDNTIVCYDNLFYQSALDWNLVPEEINKNKNSIRDYLRAIGKNDNWTELQGYVYGLRMQEEAVPYPGVKTFFKKSKINNITLYIISHKTKYPALGKSYDLHKAAWNWLEFNGFLDDPDICISRDMIFFNETKEEKIDRIKQLNCNYFIDDLPEIFENDRYPGKAVSCLFNPSNKNIITGSIINMFESWDSINKFFFNENGCIKIGK